MHLDCIVSFQTRTFGPGITCIQRRHRDGGVECDLAWSYSSARGERIYRRSEALQTPW